jgi:hypothetical protein
MTKHDLAEELRKPEYLSACVDKDHPLWVVVEDFQIYSDDEVIECYTHIPPPLLDSLIQSATSGAHFLELIEYEDEPPFHEDRAN